MWLSGEGGRYRHESRVARIEGYEKLALILYCHRSVTVFERYSLRYYFWGWLESRDMREKAIRQHKRRFGKIETLKKADVSGLQVRGRALMD